MDVTNEEQGEEPTTEQPDDDREMDEAEIFQHLAANRLPISLDSAMALNLAYQEKVQELLEKLDQKLKENAQKEKELEKELEEWNGFEWEREAEGFFDTLIRVPAQLYFPPYLRDYDNMAPIPNSDAVSRRKLAHLNALIESPRKRNDVEKNKLPQGIRESLLDKELAPRPWLNHDPTWNDQELEKLRQLVEKYHGRDWKKIGQEFGVLSAAAQQYGSLARKISQQLLVRTETQRRDRGFSALQDGLKRKQQRKVQSDEEEAQLQKGVNRFGAGERSMVSTLLGGRGPSACRAHYRKLSKVVEKGTEQ